MEPVKHLIGEAELLLKQNRRHEAIDLLERCCSEALGLLGVAYAEELQFDQARMLFDMCRRLNKNNWKMETNIAHVFSNMGQHREAVESARRAVKFSDSKECLPLFNYGILLSHVHDISAARQVFEQTIDLDPDNHLNKHNYSALLLQIGEYQKGWEFYEERLRGFDGPARFVRRYEKVGVPLWEGQDLDGRKLVVFNEQGLGDLIHFIRFVPLIKERWPQVTVVLEVQETIQDLIRDSFPGFQVVPRIDYQRQQFSDPPHGDYAVSVCSLGHVLQLYDPHRFPNRPYLSAPGRSQTSSDRFQVGICWAGNVAHELDCHRSVPVGIFHPLCEMPNVRVFSLQKSLDPVVRKWRTGVVNLLESRENLALEEFPPSLHTMSDTALLVADMDLVVTVDTSIAHLAGALGKPVWMLTPYISDWRWGLEKADCLWYPTMTLFRQKESEPWSAVVDRIASRLETDLRSWSPGHRL